VVGGPYLVVHDAVRLLAVLLQHGDRLELAVVVMAGARPTASLSYSPVGTSVVGGPYLVVHDAVRLLAVLLQHGDRLELAVVVVAGVAAARPRHERAVEVGSVVEPGAVVVVGRTHAAAARQLHTQPYSPAGANVQTGGVAD